MRRPPCNQRISADRPSPRRNRPSRSPAATHRSILTRRRETVVSAPLRLAAPALLVAARFRDITLATRLLRSDEPRTFAIGNARGADAPVNPAWLPEMSDPQAPRRHLLVEPTPGGFVLNLTSAMRAVLQTELQALPLGPDLGRADAPLMLPPGSHLLVPCGEVTFDLQPAEPAATVPRPWLPAGWRAGVKYPLVVALLLGLLLAIAHLIPSDPRALSLDTLDASGRMARLLTVPLEVTAPEIDQARALQKPAGGSGSAAAPKPSGQAGDEGSRDTSRHMTIQGTARPRTARAVRRTSTKQLARGVRRPARAVPSPTSSLTGRRWAPTSRHRRNLVASNAGAAFGAGGLGPTGPARAAAGEREGTIGGGGPLRHDWSLRPRPGSGPGLRHRARHRRAAHAAPTVPRSVPGDSAREGTLDKEIIRRTVRRHLNEVKYCYEQALVTRPSLAGRVVVQFAIAPTGRVLTSVVQSSSLGVAAVDSCVVNAVKRWEFPQPDHGGLAVVSYPFSFSPAGG